MRFIVTCNAWGKSDTQVEQPPELEAGLRLGGHCQELSIGFGVGINLQKLSWNLSTCKTINNSVMVIVKPKANIKRTFSKNITISPVCHWHIFKLLKFLPFLKFSQLQILRLSFNLDVGKGE